MRDNNLSVLTLLSDRSILHMKIISQFTQMISGLTQVCLTIVLVLLCSYKFNILRYWRDRNIPYVTPIPFFGNLLDVFLFKCNFGEKLSTIYVQFKSPVVGMFLLNRPVLLIRDQDLIRKVIIENFNSFSHKTIAKAFDEETNPNEATGMFTAKYEIWKILRKTMTPVFSFLKLKTKMMNIECCIAKMLKYIENHTAKTKEVNMRDISVRYTTEVLCSVFFGIEAECFENEHSPFRLMTERLFNYKIFHRGFQTAMFFISPILSKILRLEFFDKMTAEHLFGILSHQQEKQTNVRRKNDYLDIVTEAMKTYSGKGNLLYTSLEIFGAGYEATASSLTFAFYELVKNAEIQQKLRDDALGTFGGGKQFTYEQLNDMTYLDAFVKEVLRMYPIVPFLDRVCTQDYIVENPNIVIEKGMSVYVSILGMHYDPELFPNPHTFRPERFQDEKIKWSAYFPFGKGPKMCIAKRYSEMVIKSCLVHVLTRFELKSSTKTIKEMKLNSRGFSLQPSEDLYLELNELT